MRKSMMVMMMMGIMGMVLMAGMGSFFVGKMGNAENASPLRKELLAIYGHQMKNPETLRVSVLKDEGGAGVIVSFTPKDSLSRDKQRRDRQIRRLANHVLGQPDWEKLSFVEVHLLLPEGQTQESRFDRSSPPAFLE